MGKMQHDSSSMSGATELQWEATRAHRPNVLVECSPSAVGSVVSQLMRSCAEPHQHYSLPCALELPADTKGTLLLENLAALTAAQQRELYDWMSKGTDTQVISVATAPMTASLGDGEFLEDLFYRLNVVRLDAPAVGDVPLSGAEQEAPQWSIFGRLSVKRLILGRAGAI